MKILIVEDDPDIREALGEALQHAHHQPELAASAQEAWGLLELYPFDAIICDVGLPEGERAGFELVRELRHRGILTPVLYLTGLDSLEDTVKGLDAGGDDYILKPFRVPEILARLRAHLRRARPASMVDLEQDGLTIEWKHQKVCKDGKEVRLTHKEYQLLELLASNQGRIYSRDELLDRIWDGEFQSSTNLVDVYVSMLRKKIGEEFIENVRGRGYRFPDGASGI
ncbi:response regulator transcription factor [Deinococcus cellulosilyticus]|uniref:Response regulator n=1 Tax=Deinococcus cellulosilyticus (strain DSM 18568 / NBRC 106333 / KACC 11606 / 5516J-15) TaxID=1223518 RepID=A0A511MVP9_DEIC1|nr:response regulator transcription factor [Deinococcus cellulosilyticus]GEM44471.1 response regulator [Deinococcus cellulosilyticus NBRC 106333 = KACC 11606]